MDNRAGIVCWASLIDGVLIEIFSKLDFDSLISVASVCHSWRCVAHYTESWDRVHFCHHERFVDNYIKETVAVDNQERLFRESKYMIRHVGAGARSIYVCRIADDTMVQMIADRCPSIESISLRYCNRNSPSALINIIQACKLLKFIDIKFCGAVNFCSPLSTLLIEEMGQSCPSLVGINLGCLQVTEEMAIAIGKFLPKLKWFNLNAATISCEVLCIILDSCTELDHVSVRGCR
ncbi:F-box protein SKIP1-like isoform X2 [Magnolia sinica]|uniref:F-box protein SKIP1-like isoform X2 n=1 Tax=Magnolia sinica TaxID=86752 RepID=UPI00265A812E|nr:F-box protein SKIP1-like isoform X2 [Magnolia sinica]